MNHPEQRKPQCPVGHGSGCSGCGYAGRVRKPPESMRAVTGLEKDAPLKDTDLKAGAEAYLTAHGMSAETIAALRANLK